MSKLSRASVHLDVDAGTSPLVAKPESDTPFRILLMGDFSGRANRGTPAPAKWKPRPVDRDNFDRVLASLGPELHLGGPERGILLRFGELDDFHPDRIYENVAAFANLRETRRRLADPATFTAAAAALSRAPQEPPPAAPPPAMPRISTGNLLDDILETSETGQARAARPADELRAFIDRAVAPHLAPRQDPQLPELMARVDARAGELMRALMHQRDFQALEAAWRAVFLLVRGLETGTQLRLYLLDISKAELAAHPGALRDVLVEDVPGAEPWALAVGNYAFSRTESDINLLAELARTMRAAGAPFLAEADPRGEPDSPRAARLWDALRRSPEAAWVGLALPRFLLRLPYGASTDALERFAFEEMPKPDHAAYLWGNPAFACAYLLGQAFENSGWDLRPGECREITGLPLHVYEEDGEQQVKPCAEIWMTERDADWILEQGFMPLASLKNQDAARLLRFQSIADPPAALAGRWS